MQSTTHAKDEINLANFYLEGLPRCPQRQLRDYRSLAPLLIPPLLSPKTGTASQEHEQQEREHNNLQEWVLGIEGVMCSSTALRY